MISGPLAFPSQCIMFYGNQDPRLPLAQVAVRLVELFSLVYKEMKMDPAGGSK